MTPVYRFPKLYIRIPLFMVNLLIMKLLTISLLFSFFLAAGQPPTQAELGEALKNATDTARINLMIKLATMKISQEMATADSLAVLILEESRVRNYLFGEVMGLNLSGHILTSRGKMDEGLEKILEALDLAITSGDQLLMAESYDDMNTVRFLRGEHEEAREAAEKAKEIAEEIGLLRIIARSNNNLAVYHGIKGNHVRSIEYFLEAYGQYEKLGSRITLCNILLNIGHTFEMAGNQEKAIDYLRRSLKISREENNSYYEGWALVNIGVVHDRLNQRDSAIFYIQQSLQISEDNDYFRLRLTSLDNLGAQYSMLGDFERSADYLNTAYRLADNSGQNARMPYITGNLAENYLYMKQYDSALFFAGIHLKLAKEQNLMSEQQVAYYTLAQVHDSLGDLRSANDALNNYIIIRDSLFNKDKSEQVEALRESYEASEREEEIIRLDEQRKAELFRRNTFAGTAGFLLLAGLLVYRNQRLKVRKNRELYLKEQEVDQLKSRFYDNVTHEFRTPLTLILGPIEMMREQEKDEHLIRHLDIMEQNANRLLELVNQMLELTRLESGKIRLQAAWGNVVPLVKGVVMSFESAVQLRHISLEVESEEEEINLYFDRVKLEQILINLVSNALKHVPDHGRIVTSLHKKEGHLELSVQDNGPGIPPEEIGQVFDRFFRATTPATERTTGTGIGLALVRELAELHYGKIKIESPPDGGVRFVVSLPLGHDHLKEEEVIDQAPSASVPPQPVRGSVSFPDPAPDPETGDKPVLLVVEDNTDVMNYIVEVLREDFKILQAANGREGLDLSVESVPDLIISDVMMPVMDGFAFCEAVKNHVLTSHIPVILLTAKSQSADRIEGYNHQADDYLTKPFIPQELRVRVTNLITSRRKLREKFEQEMRLKPEKVQVESREQQFVHQLMDVMERELGHESFGVEQFAEEMNLSRSQLHRKLVAVTNQNPTRFIRHFRLVRARDLLESDAGTVSEIAYQVGFSSPSYFTKCFREEFGITPGDIPGKS